VIFTIRPKDILSSPSNITGAGATAAAAAAGIAPGILRPDKLQMALLPQNSGGGLVNGRLLPIFAARFPAFVIF
jgi:hypothetical protein